MQAYNFSKLNKREKKVYSFGDINLSKTGIDSRFLIIVAVLIVVSLVINLGVSAILGRIYFSPFQQDGLDFTPLLFVLGIPIGLAAALFYIKINNYRLVDFLIIYFQPKHTIDTTGKRVEQVIYKYDAFLEKQYSATPKPMKNKPNKVDKHKKDKKKPSVKKEKSKRGKK